MFVRVFVPLVADPAYLHKLAMEQLTRTNSRVEEIKQKEFEMASAVKTLDKSARLLRDKNIRLMKEVCRVGIATLSCLQIGFDHRI